MCDSEVSTLIPSTWTWGINKEEERPKVWRELCLIMLKELEEGSGEWL